MEASHALPLLLAMLFIAILSSSSIASVSDYVSPDTIDVSFVKIACNSTRYPNICNTICLPFAKKIKSDYKRMAHYALVGALGAAKNASRTVAKLSKDKGLERSEKEAIKDCIELAKDSIVQIKASIREIAYLKNAKTPKEVKFKLSNAKIWMSAALTNYDTCIEGLDEQDVGSSTKGKITDKFEYATMLSSNSLAIINRI